MRTHASILYIEYAEMVATGVSDRTVKSWTPPVKVKDPSDHRKVLIQYEALRDKYKAMVIAKYGDPYAYEAHSLMLQHLQPDMTARRYYEQYKSASGMQLPRDRSDKLDYPTQLSIAADWLNLYIAIHERSLPVCSETLRAWRADGYQTLRLLMETKGIWLPYSYAKLNSKKNAYWHGTTRHYEALIPATLENDNSQKLTEAQVILLKQLIGRQQNFYAEKIQSDFNLFALSQGWTKSGKPLTISAQTVLNYYAEHKKQLEGQRKGTKAWRGTYRVPVMRQRPSTPLLMTAHDGWDVELYYKKQVVNKKGHYVWSYYNRKVAVLIIDPYNDYILGYATGDTETGELVKSAWRSAMSHIHSLTGGYHLPHQIKCDNHGGLADWLTAIVSDTAMYTPIQVGNSQDNPIEPFFNRLNTEYFQPCVGWSGRGVTSSKDTQANREWLERTKQEFKTEEEWIAYMDAVVATDRAKKAEAWLSGWAVADKRAISREEYLRLFGMERRDTVKLSNRGIHTQIAGEYYDFTLLDHDFYSYADASFRIIYDPLDLSSILAISDEYRVSYHLPRAYRAKMALKDNTTGDREALNRVLDFRKAEEQIQIDRNAEELELVEAQMRHIEALTAIKVMPVVQGQQKGALTAGKRLLAMPHSGQEEFNERDFLNEF